MAGINKTIIIGNIGKEPRFSVTQSGMAVNSFRVAVTKKRKNGDKQTTWFSVVTWGRTAEFVRDYLNKGSQVYIEGELREGKPWTNREGVTIKELEVHADVLQSLGGEQRGQGRNRAGEVQSRQGYQGQTGFQGEFGGGGGFVPPGPEVEDDIPF